MRLEFGNIGVSVDLIIVSLRMMITEPDWRGLGRKDKLKNWRKQIEIPLSLSFIIKKISAWRVMIGQGRVFCSFV